MKTLKYCALTIISVYILTFVLATVKYPERLLGISPISSSISQISNTATVFAPIPGNNITEAGEACDGTDVNGYTCATVAAGFKSGTLACNADRKSYDVSECVQGDVINALSCEQEDVQNAVDSAVDGDIVIVPAGICNWTQRLTLTKSILLKGAGIDQTTLINGVSSGSSSDYLILLDPDLNVRSVPMTITGFTFDAAQEGGAIQVDCQGDNFAFDNFRIHHNLIKNTLDTGDSYMSIRLKGDCFGLIDNNRFENNYYDFKIYGDDGNSWDDYPGEENMGSRNFLYIEDSNSTRADYFILTSGEGARWVYRYNLVDYADVAGTFDAHGDTRNRGVVGHELYNNVITCQGCDSATGGHKFHDYRGGTGIIFNNSVWAGTSGTRTFIAVREEYENCTVAECYEELGDTKACGDEVNNGYIWNNYNPNLDDAIISVWAYDTYDCISENNSWWDDAIRSPGGESPSNFYYNLSINRPSTCTEDDSYYEIDNERLYRCTTTDNWELVYVPYVYPHPLSLIDVEEENIPICGNNITEAGEACDDGNLVDGDGCSSTCTLEEDIACTSHNYTDWSICTNNTQSHTLISSFPEGCIGGEPIILTQACTINIPACTYTDPAWSTCSNSTQTRTRTATNQPCTGDISLIENQSCTNTQTGGGGGGGGGSSSNTVITSDAIIVPTTTATIITTSNSHSTTQTNTNSNNTICRFIELLININVITPAKAPLARQALNCSTNLFSVPTISTTQTSPVSSSALLTINLYPGMRSSEVIKLKTFLTKYNYLSDVSGTDYYGPLTTEAVQKFQIAKNIVSSGTPETTGFGAVGPKTRDIINGIGR